MLLDLIFLPAVFLLGIVTTYEDIKYNKIYNKRILLALLYGFGLLWILSIWTLMGLYDVSFANNFYLPGLYYDVLFNFLISSFTAILIWQFKIWAAGDAKLFLAFTLLIPLHFYSKGYLELFPSSAVLINIFVPVFIFIFLRSVFFLFYSLFLKSRTGNLFKNFEEKIKNSIQVVNEKKYEWLKLFFVTLAIFIFIQILREKMNLFLMNFFKSQAFIFILLMIIYKPLQRLMKKNSKLFIFSLVVLGGYFVYGLLKFPHSLFEELKMIIIYSFSFVFIFIIVESIFGFYIKSLEEREININKLKERMILTQESQARLKKLDEALYTEKLEPFYPDGLTNEQVEIIERLADEKEIKTIKIYKTFSFAPWIFAGVIITLILKQSIVHLFMKIL